MKKPHSGGTHVLTRCWQFIFELLVDWSHFNGKLSSGSQFKKRNQIITIEDKYTCKWHHVHHLRIFSYITYLHIPKKKKTWEQNKKMSISRIYDPIKWKIIISKDVTFDEPKGSKQSQKSHKRHWMLDFLIKI
jgi:hypothetical protein